MMSAEDAILAIAIAMLASAFQPQDNAACGWIKDNVILQ